MKISVSILVRKFILAISAALVLSLFIFLFPSCANKNGDEEQAQEVSLEEMNVQVKTVKIETGEIPIMVKAVGVLLPRMQSPALIVSLIPGVVSKVEVNEGQTVEAGTVIIRLDPRKADNALAKAKAALRLVESDLTKAIQGGLDMEQSDLDLDAREAEVTAQQAKLDADRQKSLFAEHLTSEKAAFDSEKAMEEANRRAKAAQEKADLFRKSGREMELVQLQAAVEQAKAELAAAEFDREMMDIRAPVTGRISGLKVNVGSAVDDQTVLAHVIGERTSVIRLLLSPADTENIQLNASVIVKPVSSEQPLLGRVVSIGYELDSETGLVPVEAQFEPNQSGATRIGETVFAEITTKSNAKGFIVPVSSIVVEDDKASLFTVDNDQIAHAVPIKILAQTAEQAVVWSEGLAVGDRAISDGNYNLPNGAHVVEEPSK